MEFSCSICKMSFKTIEEWVEHSREKHDILTERNHEEDPALKRMLDSN